MITSIEHGGVLVQQCLLPGETRADDVFPAHCNAILLSQNRWLVLYATRGFEGIDDDRSIVYQIRANTPDGEVLRENWIAKSITDWRPFDDDFLCRKEHGHPVAFGVPKGAHRAGELVPSQNVFAVKWRILGKALDHAQRSRDDAGTAELQRRTQGVEWLQFRLNETEDDIEILQPARPLRQTGYETGPRFCAHDVAFMNQTFVQAVTLDETGARWGDVNHFDGGRIALMEYTFNPARGVYEWTGVGPLLGGEATPVFEASLVRTQNDFVVAARKTGGSGSVWWRLRDPFKTMSVPAPLALDDPLSYAPLSVYRCADGIVRLLTGDPQASPYGNGRNPLYVWDIVLDKSVVAANRRVLFDARAAGLPIRPEAGSVVDMGKILPHAGGDTQYFVHRVRPKAINIPANTKAVVNAEEKECAAIYYGVIRYESPRPAAWQWK